LGFFHDPNSILGQLPGMNQDPVPVPNPTQGMMPALPSAAVGNMSPAVPPAIRNEVAPPTLSPVTEHNVDLVTGYLKQSETDIKLPGIGFGFELERSYSSNNQEPGPFGRGWNHNMDTLLRMYAEFAMGEFRQDGSTKTYKFLKDDPNGFVTSYDGDTKTNYELHKGHYEPSDGDTLTRISQLEYVVTNRMGLKLRTTAILRHGAPTKTCVLGK
jgi:hypothetical protein